MRIILLSLGLFMTLNAKAYQKILPSFPSDLLDEEIVVGEVLANPKTILEESYAYDEKMARMEFQPIAKTYSYQDGNLLSVLFTKDDEDFFTYSFDRFGRIIKQERNDPESIISKVEYHYLDNERRAKETVYRNTGTIHSERVVIYDENNNLIKREEYSGVGQLERYWIYVYDEQRQLAKENYFDKEKGGLDQVNEVKTYKSRYNKSGDLEEVATYVADQLLSVEQYYQDLDSSSYQKTIYLQNGMPSERRVAIEMDSLRVVVNGFYSHNDTSRFSSRFQEIYIEGDKIEYESRTLGGTQVNRYATFYEYDPKGNWIKKTIYTNGVPSHVVQRYIRY